MARFVVVILVLVVGVVCAGCAARSAQPSGETGVAVACVAGVDSDRDTLSDSCEIEFARAFAPVLRIAPQACNRDAHAGGPRLAGEYLFGVRRISTDTIRIVYLPAYHQDCGWSGAKCLVVLIDCSPHSGDSELIAVSVVRERETARADVGAHGAGGRGSAESNSRAIWRTTAVFLSSHCFGPSAVNCRWYDDASLARVEWAAAPRGAPVVWVAEGRNANYLSRAACDAGHWLFDTCDRNDVALRYPVESHRNIGSAAQPIGGDGCVSRAELAGGRAADAQTAVECFWSDVAFTGWQRPAQGAATPYVRYLRMVFQAGP